MTRTAHGRAAFATTVALAATAAPALAQAPPGPPGPPPGGGTALPAPPGTAPAFVPPGTPATIPSGVTGPGLLSNADVVLNRSRRSFSVPLACQGNGTLRVRARPLTPGTIARTRYHCAHGRATARLSVTPAIARRLARRRAVAAMANARQGVHTARLYFSLTAGHADTPAKGFWTDGHLDCSGAYLVEPDFTTATPTQISTRGWIAWYTPGGGWHWLGTGGEDSSRWDTWTATVAGIAQFHPNGARQPTPWTWGPISVPGGQGIYAIGVYEIVYWVGGHPEYQWQYVNAGTTGAAAAGGGNLYCAYP
jgi:hypothetical protein